MQTIPTVRPTANLDDARAGTAKIMQIAKKHSPVEPLGQTPDFAKSLRKWLDRRHELNSEPLDISQGREDELFDLLDAAERKLISIPLKSVSELRAIAEVIWTDPHSLPSSDILAKLFTGLKALDVGNPSPTFCPTEWLDCYQRNGGGWVERDGEITLIHPAEPRDSINDLMWVLDTRDGLELVKKEIRARNPEPKPREVTWGKLLSDYQSADARLGEHDNVRDNSECGSPENLTHEAKTDRLADEHSNALNALFRHPSPDFEAFEFKAKLYATRDVYSLNEAAEFAEIIAREAARFNQ